MKLANYSPTYRQVLFTEIHLEEDTKTSSGLFLPTKDTFLRDFDPTFNNERIIFDGSKTVVGVLKVIKVGPDCTTVQPGDFIVLMQGIKPQIIELDNDTFFTVSEQQIVGFERRTNQLNLFKDDSISDAPRVQSKDS